MLAYSYYFATMKYIEYLSQAWKQMINLMPIIQHGGLS